MQAIYEKEVVKMQQDNARRGYNTSDHDEFKCWDLVVRSIKFAFFPLTGYPYLSPAYIRQQIDKPTTSREELDCYKLTARPTWQAVVARYTVLLSSVLCLINSLTLPWTVFRRLDLKRPEANVAMLNKNTYRFTCLVSNCTTLRSEGQEMQEVRAMMGDTRNHLMDSREQLFRALLKLPYLSLCQPVLSKFYEPYHHFGENGMFMFTIVGFTVLFGGLLALIRNFYGANNLFLMFLVAPRVTRQVVQERASEMLQELASSRHNYRIFWAHNCATHKPAAELFLLSDCKHQLAGGFALPPAYRIRPRLQIRYESLIFNYNNHNADPALARTLPLPHQPSRQERDREKLLLMWKSIKDEQERELNVTRRQSDSAAKDCITTMRSGWWRSRAVAQVGLMTGLITSLIIAERLLGYCLMLILITKKQEHLNQIGSNMATTNCSIWIMDESEPSESNYYGKLIQLDKYQLSTGELSSLVFLILAAPPIFCYINFWAFYMMTIEELTGWLCECKFELLLGTEFVRQLVASSTASVNENDSRSEPIMTSNTCKFAHIYKHNQQSRFNLTGNIRSRFRPLTGWSFVINDCKLLGNDGLPTRSRLESAQAIEEYVTQQIAADKMCLCSAIDLLEKLHTSLRIFIEHVDYNQSTVTVMITFANLLVYVYVCIDLFFVSRSRDFRSTPLVHLFLSWSFANFIIGCASNM